MANDEWICYVRNQLCLMTHAERLVRDDRPKLMNDLCILTMLVDREAWLMNGQRLTVNGKLWSIT